MFGSKHHYVLCNMFCFCHFLQSARFKQLLVDTALEGIEENFKIKVDRKRMKNLKMSYKGIASSSVLRVPKEEVI